MNELSEEANTNIKDEFNKYGIEVVNFNIENINIPDDELKKIQEVMYKTFEAKELSNVELGESYAALKSFEILKDAANNESDGSVGSMMSAGIGLGAGFPLGQQMGTNLNVNNNQQPSQTKDVPTKLKELKDLLDQGLISEDQYNEKQSKLLEEL